MAPSDWLKMQSYDRMGSYPYCYSKTTFITYRIRPNYRPCPHNSPPDFLLYITTLSPLNDLFPDFLLYFPYYRPLDDLLALLIGNKFT